MTLVGPFAPFKGVSLNILAGVYIPKGIMYVNEVWPLTNYNAVEP